MTIYLYQDQGVSDESVKHTISAFRKLLKKEVVTINATEVKEGLWTKDAILFIIPGGADLPYTTKLNGQGNQVIKNYVKKGGSYLGICAGSYYGASEVEFDKKGPLEIVGKRELSFFKGKVVGPILAPYDYKSLSGSRAATINTILPTVTKTVVFYNGGGFFEKAAADPKTKVIATYENTLPAIVLIKYGQGKVLLSGVHFEYDPLLLDVKDQNIAKIIEPLKINNESREALFRHLIEVYYL
jgi:biotin--protein ligase